MMIRRMFCSLLVIMTLSGCGMSALQKQQVASFGKATEAMGTFAETELVQIRQDVVQMNTDELILNSAQTNPQIDLDKPLKPESALKRVTAAQALKSYGTLLNQLATADRTEGIKKAAGDVVANFDSALDQGLTDKQREAATGLIVSLGNMWIEKQKKDAVKQIVDDYKSAVDKVTDLLAQDFLSDGEGYLGGYTAVAGNLKNTAIKVLTQGQHPSFAEREKAVQAFVTSEKAAINAREIDSKAKKAIENLKKANSNLSKVMANDKYTSEDLKSYTKSITELVNMVNVLADK